MTPMKKRLRSILCIALVACYFAGLLFLYFWSASAGILLWVISTLGGGLALYLIHRADEKAKPEEETPASKENTDEN